MNRYRVLRVQEVAAQLGVSRFTVYNRIKAERLPAFRALYDSGPYRFLATPTGVLRPLPHFHRRPVGDHVPWVEAAEVARVLRISTRLVLAACAAKTIAAFRSPGATRRARYRVAIDSMTRLPLPSGPR